MGAITAYAVIQHGFRVDLFLWPLLIAVYPLAPLRMLAHEGGHFIAARRLGWEVDEVRLGGGKELFTFPIGKTRWTIGRGVFRGGGFCKSLPEPDMVTQRACILFVLAGSLTELVLAVALVPFFSASFAGRVVVMFAILCVVDAVWSLAPSKDAGAFARANDGEHIRRLIRAPEKELAEWRMATPLFQAIRYMEAGQKADAIAVVENAFPQPSADRRTRGMIAWVKLVCGRPQAALAHVEDYALFVKEIDSEATGELPDEEGVAYVRSGLLVQLDRLDEVVALAERHRDAATDEEVRARWSACVALALLLRGHDADSVARASAAAAYGFARLPWVSYVLTAQGISLIEQGEHDEGLRLFDLCDAREGARSSLRDAWRVVAHAACGRDAVAHELLKTLRAADAWPACLRRAEAATTG